MQLIVKWYQIGITAKSATLQRNEDVCKLTVKCLVTKIKDVQHYPILDKPTRKTMQKTPWFSLKHDNQLGLWLRLECSLDSLSIDSAHVIYVSEGYDVAYNRRTASQPSHVVLRVTWYVKTFQKRKLRVLNPARINVFYWFNWLHLIGS